MINPMFKEELENDFIKRNTKDTVRSVKNRNGRICELLPPFLNWICTCAVKNEQTDGWTDGHS